MVSEDNGQGRKTMGREERLWVGKGGGRETMVWGENYDVRRNYGRERKTIVLREIIVRGINMFREETMI